ncbi:MAG: DUF4336 domain-containing protein [Myxococcales bacterium]|nr:DUF4336 domain-containing protein [Myxococcales bacterium]
MRCIAPGVHVVDRPLQFLGLEIGARMTVLELGEGLLLHSPVDVDADALAEIGAPRWALAPNKLHHLFAKPWADAGVETWAAPGLPQKRTDVSFAGVVDSGTHPFGPEVHVLTLQSFSLTNEVVLFHEPSKTLVVTDLLFNFQPTDPWLTRVAMRCACAYPGTEVSLLERFGMKRSVAREEIGAILDWPFERIVMSHGAVVERDAKERFAHAYRWLGL